MSDAALRDTADVALTMPSGGPPRRRLRAATAEAPWVRIVLITVGLFFAGLFLLLPLVLVFSEALSEGLGAYFAAMSTPDSKSAIGLTLLIAAIAVPANILFGVAAAW